MDICIPSEQPDLTLQLPRSTYWQVVHTLQTSLPPPVDETPEALAHRDRAAIAAVAAMLPGNAEEADIAARSVAAHARAMESLRLANQCPGNPAHVLRCTAQSAAMMRAANGARSLLLRVQAARRKREANPVAREQAAWTEHCAIGLMADAIGQSAPVPPPAPAPAEADAEDKFARMTEAEQYAVTYPRRAAAIRAHGGMPPDCDFFLSDPELVSAIVTGNSPILLALDREKGLISA